MEIKNEVDPYLVHIRLWIRSGLSLGFIAFILIMSFHIIRPFLTPVVWGIIISVGVYPLHKRFASFLGKRSRLSAALITLIALSVIVVPSVLITRSTVENVTKTVIAIEEDNLNAPPPSEAVKEWPLIGERTYELWSSAALSLNETLLRFKPQLKEFAPKLTKTASRAVLDIVLFFLSLVIAGVLLLYADQGKELADGIFKILLGPRGGEITELSINTIRSVVQGVIGIAVIQALFLSIGMFAIKVPAAGIFAIVVLVLAIIQLPTILVMLPISIYVFAVNDTLPAILFVVWTLLWSLSDNLLKPMFLGKGVDVPMLAVLIGAIGGMILGGAVGLFIGSVVMAWAYTLVKSLLKLYA